MKRVAQAGGTTEQVASYTGINKQLVVDTTTHRLHVMDGATQGGFPLALKSEIDTVNSSLSNKADSTHTHAKSQITGLDTALGNLIPKSGDAGSLTTMESIVTAATVNDTSARSMSLAASGTIQVQDGSSGKAWITVVALEGAATVNLGTNWKWSGSQPDLAKGLLTCAWYGTFGVANFQKWGE